MIQTAAIFGILTGRFLSAAVVHARVSALPLTLFIIVDLISLVGHAGCCTSLVACLLARLALHVPRLLPTSWRRHSPRR